MAKFSDDMEKTMKDVRAVRKATKEFIGKGAKLVAEKFHEANSLKRLKKNLREVN